MKKTHILQTIILLSLCTILSGCFSPIFYDIRKDVKPEPTTVKSPVNQITRYRNNGECLFIASDRGIRFKNADSPTHDEWKEFGIPFASFHYDFDSSNYEGEQIIGVFASSDTLYAVTATYGINDQTGITYPTSINLWGNNSGTWSKITSDSTYFPMYTYGSYKRSAFAVFQTNAISNANREVYIRAGDPNAKDSNYTTVKYYQLNGVGTPTDVTTTVTANTVDSGNCVRSAVKLGGTTYFFNAYAATTNATEDMFYYSSGDKVYSGTSKASATESVCSVGRPVTALAYTTDYLLIGCGDYNAANSNTNGGIHKTTIDSSTGELGTGTVGFSNNAQFQITSSYYVTAMLNATPDRTEANSYLYCATQLFGNNTDATFNNVGLWSWYPGRGNWNRE